MIQEEIIENNYNSLEDVISKMKDSLQAIKDGMNVKTLTDINREYTPLELPPLMPLMMRYVEIEKNQYLYNLTQRTDSSRPASTESYSSKITDNSESV